MIDEWKMALAQHGYLGLFDYENQVRPSASAKAI